MVSIHYYAASGSQRRTDVAMQCSGGFYSSSSICTQHSC